MIYSVGKKLVLLLLLGCGAVFMLGSVLPDSKFKTPLGGSKWCLGKQGIIATIDLNEPLLGEIRGMKQKNYNYATGSEIELQKMATEFLQPYVNEKITVAVNGTRYPVKVDRIVRHDNDIFSIWLSVKDLALDRPQNDVTINYRMLFDELKKDHLNQALLYRSDAAGAALEKVFDYTSAEAVYWFAYDSPAWELKAARPTP